MFISLLKNQQSIEIKIQMNIQMKRCKGQGLGVPRVGASVLLTWGVAHSLYVDVFTKLGALQSPYSPTLLRYFYRGFLT